MRRALVGSTAVFLIANANAQTTVDGSFMHGGRLRTYSFHVPPTYVPGQAVPLVIGLHGLGSSGADMATFRDFRPIADTANFIMAYPDGTELLGVRFWNYGNVLGSTVDDVGFLEALIDTIAGHYTIDPQRVYATGMSNGSFMAYALACQSVRFAAVGGVTGSMSVDMYSSCSPAHPTPIIHVHGTADGTNPYAGSSTMVGIDTLIAYWVGQNDCTPLPTSTSVPDNDPSDGAIAQHHVYSNGIGGRSVELFKVTEGGHTWPGSIYPGSNGNTCMDFDARVEIWRFFSQFTLSQSTGVLDVTTDAPVLWPNPTTGRVHLHGHEDDIVSVHVTDLQGQWVQAFRPAPDQSVDLGHLPAGIYLLHITSVSSRITHRLIVEPDRP